MPVGWGGWGAGSEEQPPKNRVRVANKPHRDRAKQKRRRSGR